MSFSERRCRIVEHLASAWWHLTSEGQQAPDDVLMLLEHRLRDALRAGRCPDCFDGKLAKKLDKEIEIGKT